VSATVLELFSGCGGAALGLHRAGFIHHACIEWDADAAATLVAAGFPGIQGDVRTVDYAPYAGRTDLLWASPPCQAGSTAGKRRGASDDRNGWPWTMDVIDAVKPTWFLAENVLGWTYHKGGCKRRSRGLTCIGCYWERWILPELRRRFAFVGWWRVNAADYGTPQHRRRVILWAGPLPLPADPPTPSHLDDDEGALPEGVRSWVSIREAVGDTLNRTTCDRRVCYPCDGTHGRACSEGWRYDRPAPTVVTVEEKGTRARSANGWTFNGGPDRASDTAFLVAGIRRIDIEEGLILQGFPVDWPLQGSKHARYRQVGNAVPPQLSEALGRTILFADRIHQRLSATDHAAMAEALRRSGQTLPQAV
jgi:DNA (cytosine-5)-methyltransferase 1